MNKSMELLAQRAPLVARGGRWLAGRVSPLWNAWRAPSARTRLARLRRDVGQLLRIEPVFVASDREGFLQAMRAAQLDALTAPHEESLGRQPSGRLHLRRFCLCCNETTAMLVDYVSSFTIADGSRPPNWRERLICSQCGMNNRQRLVAKLVQQAAASITQPRVYLMEQVTPIFGWVSDLPGTIVQGSEYLGHQHRGGEVVKGIRHEDVMKLSFPDASFDLIVSNDVMEHIPDPQLALRECCRVLKPGGSMLATFPFQSATDVTRTRAKLVDGVIEHLLPPEYHGNPLSSEGSLVFSYFGWDLLDAMREAGFASADCEVYCSDEFGHLGSGLLVFRMGKSQH